MQHEGALPPPGSGPRPAGGFRRLLPLVLFAAFAGGMAILIGRNATPTLLLEHYDSLRLAVASHPHASMLGYVAVYALAVAFSIPGSLLLTVVGGLLFGWLPGGAAAIVAATMGGVVMFLLARTTLGSYLSDRGGSRLHALLKGLRDDAVNYLLFLRIVPVFPFWLVNIAAGVVGMRLHQFLIATVIGIIPGTLAFASAGAALDGVVIVQKAALDACVASGRADCRFDLSLSNVLTPGVLAALAALGLMALIPVAVKRWRKLVPAKTPAPPGNYP
jgi:uncharacterized membrane protein YdjX (TVP38/TMEM64 family)